MGDRPVLRVVPSFGHMQLHYMKYLEVICREVVCVDLDWLLTASASAVLHE